MQFGSTARNINFLTIASALATVTGFLFPSLFTLPNILISICSFYILNILGIWMTLHRFYSHRSFKFKNSILYWIFTIIAIIAGRGSPLGWVYLHRHHHKYSDTEKDPHSPKFLGYKLFGFDHMRSEENNKMEIFLVKDLMTPQHLFIHKWYMVIMLAFILLFAFINIEIFYFAWVIPAFAIQLSQSNFNYFGHIYGYRNFETKDNSRNNPWLFPIILGEAWHNNHHANPSNFSTTEIKKEIDPLTWIIKVLKA